MKRTIAKLFITGALAAVVLLVQGPGISEPGRKYLEYGVMNFSGKLHPVFRDSDQRVRFMLKMSSELVAPVPNYCIDLLHRRLGKDGPQARANPAPEARTTPALATGSYEGLLRLTQNSVENPANPEVEGEGCHDALASCGNCHLPKINNCTYTVHYLENKTPKQITGQVVGRTIGGVKIQPGEGREVLLAAKSIVKSDWLDGGDPIETWWDFETFGARGKTAAKMLDIVHEHKVACTNCHLQHGDFRLTEAGKAFQKDETIIKNVPLEAILK